ncbi:chemotaxis protein CheW [Luedemannella flava]|uniref:histidine kinase n=1 Tax=Luedemannella flava TaxID=349316 RepID=A0ABN2LWH1_9ACTN
MEELDEIVQEFLVESHENLDTLDGDLVALEQEPDSRELISRIFRTIHTIKGTSGFLAFNRLEGLTHAGESLLSRLRDGVQPVTPDTITTLLATLDGVRKLLAEIETTGVEGDHDVSAIVEQINRQMAGESAPAPAAPAAAPAAPVAVETPPAPAAVETPAPPVVVETPAAPVVVETPAKVAELPTEAPLPPWIADLDDHLDAGSTPGTEGTAQRRSIADSAIRVDVDVLDSLMTLVGELVLVRNQLVRAADGSDDPVVVRTTQRLNLITSELQEGIMKTRMQPIEQIWSKMPRVARDLSQAFSKQVNLVMEGKETELDRTLLEAVKDPLTHLVRNAIDHGIETPEDRVAAGKPAEGTLTLRAYHESGHVTVEIADDGAGIDTARVAQTAISRGLITEAQAARMEPRELMTLVFQPGFSTAKKVTNVSGRGVGMDVVKTNIENVGGTVDVESNPGAGTTWRLTIPLTLAIIQAITVESAGERYVVPQVAVLELVHVDNRSNRIEYAAGAPVYRLRGKLLPLVSLDQTLGVAQDADGEGGRYVLVLQADGRRFGMLVDRVLNTEEVVVKALTNRFKELGVYAGATILGDGKVALILDVASLARRSNLATGGAERESADNTNTAALAGTADRLLVTSLGERRVAIPLDSVTRLEEFAVDRIEHVMGQEVVQYRGQILPMVRLSHLIGTGTEVAPATDVVSAVVYTERGRSVAMVVDQIVDIVEDSTSARRDFNFEGLVGSAVIEKRVTELLDVRRAILAADPHFYSHTLEQEMVEA